LVFADHVGAKKQPCQQDTAIVHYELPTEVSDGVVLPGQSGQVTTEQPKSVPERR
jgi:hypothetical protein